MHIYIYILTDECFFKSPYSTCMPCMISSCRVYYASLTVNTVYRFGHFYVANHPDEIEFYNPLQSQPSDEVELNSTGFANFTCATEGLPYSQEMRVCQVDYTRAPQCLDDPVELERCCSCRFYNASCPWDVRERSTVTAYRTCTVLTNNTGNYQCQVFNHAINDYQPLGDPIRVVSMHPTVSHDETSLYFDLFIGSSALAVVLLLLVALVVIVVILKKRRRNYKKDYERSEPAHEYSKITFNT